jgi:hypothetical protein
VSLSELPDVLLVVAIVAGLSLLSVLLHQLEGMLEKRGYKREAKLVGALRALLTTDAPAAVERMRKTKKGETP